MNRLEKKASEAGISIELAKKIIVYNHELKYLVPKSELKRVSINIEDESSKFIKKIAKTLKVTVGAVVGLALHNYLESNK